MERYRITLHKDRVAKITDTVTKVTVTAKVEPFHDKYGKLTAYVNYEDSITELQCEGKGRVTVPKSALFETHEFTSNLDGRTKTSNDYNKIFGF